MEHLGAAADDDGARVATLRGLRIIERDLSPQLHALLDAASILLSVDVAALALVDAETVHLKGNVLPEIPRTIPRPVAFASAVLQAGTLLVVEDLHRDARFTGFPVAGIRFIAGCPLRAPNGRCLGAFTVAARAPRSWGPDTRSAIEQLRSAAEALVALDVLKEVLRPSAHADEVPQAILGQAAQNMQRLLLALGYDEPAGAAIAVDTGYFSYDPELLRLVFRKHAPDVLKHLLQRSPARFKDIMAAVPGLNQRTLTTRLEELRAHGLVTRRSYDQIPPRVEYEIPPERRGLVHHLLQLAEPSHGSR